MCSTATRPRTILERHPRKFLFGMVVSAILLIDLVAGLLLIPPDYHSFRRPHPFFHHGLFANRETVTRWGDREYRVATNSLGLIDRAPREVVADTASRRAVFIGDSFTEGVGVTWDESFIGILQQELGPAGVEILNAGVVSYSPKLYHLKIQHLLEHAHLRFDELFVLIDISDVYDELSYEKFKPSLRDGPGMVKFRLGKLLGNFSFLYYGTQRLLRGDDPGRAGPFPSWVELDGRLENDPLFFADGLWTVHRESHRRFGVRGLALAKENVRRLVELSRRHGVECTIVVYPWPIQIERADLDSIQVRFWRRFAREHGLTFIDLFPKFVLADESPRVTKAKYFIPGDVHWNADGHRRVAESLLPYLK